MVPASSSHTPPPASVGDIATFLARTLPFSELAPETLARIARRASVDFAPAGERVFVRGVSPVTHLRVIQRGGVRVFVTSEEGAQTLMDMRGEGAAVGGLALVKGNGERSLAGLDVETVEDTFFILIEAADFRALVEQEPAVAAHFLKDVSATYVSRAIAELSLRGGGERGFGHGVGGGISASLFSARVGELAVRTPVMAPMGSTIRQAAARMEAERVGALLVTDPSGHCVGIVTDTDLRRTLAVAMDPEAVVETIMSSPVTSVRRADRAFDALLTMLGKHIHHLVVVADEAPEGVEAAGVGLPPGSVAGVVSSHDLMVLQGRSPVSLFRRILAASAVTDLYPLSGQTVSLTRALVEEGVRASNVTRLVTAINDLLLERMLTLLTRELGTPPVAYAWLLLGSEGRREQTFKTDQDNGLVLADAEDPLIGRAAEIYFEAFAERAVEHLVKMGFPRCQGGIMASNPTWRQPYTHWSEVFRRWIMVPEPKDVMHAAIFFDLRFGHGDARLVEELRREIKTNAARQDVFLRHLAANCLQTRPPLSFFRNFIVEKDGEHKNRLDLKARGLVPIVDFARVLSLKHGIGETNTLERISRLTAEEHISGELSRNVREAYEFLLQLRLVNQLSQAARGEEPDNHVNPSNLSEIEKRTLKDAFSIIAELQTFLKELFRLNVA